MLCRVKVPIHSCIKAFTSSKSKKMKILLHLVGYFFTKFSSTQSWGPHDNQSSRLPVTFSLAVLVLFSSHSSDYIMYTHMHTHVGAEKFLAFPTSQNLINNQTSMIFLSGQYIRLIITSDFWEFFSTPS